MVLSSRRLPSLLRVLASPVPRSSRYYEGATTSHSRVGGRLFGSLPLPTGTSLFVLAAALLEGRRSLPGRGAWSAGAHLPAWLTWTRIGSLRSSGDPSRASAPFHDPGRTDVPSPLTVTSMLPPLCGRRRLRQWLISGLTRSFGTRCHTLHACRCLARARLASGRPAGPLPGGSRTLWIAAKGFSSSDDHPPFLLS
jgi:hypothetical protein